MLVSFTVGNFLSFKDQQTLSMIPEALKEKQEYLHTPLLYDVNVRLLKSVGIYGHNSHGKTNFLKAYRFFQNFILTSFNPNSIQNEIEVENFKLSTETKAKPSFFEIVFYWKASKYRYGFEVTSNKVVSEWLFYAEAKVRENYLFIRSTQGIKLSKSWQREASSLIDKVVIFTQDHQLLLSALISVKNVPPRIEEIGNWFKSNIILSDLDDDKNFEKALLILANIEYRGLIDRLIEKADLGFTTISEKIGSQLQNRLNLNAAFLNIWYDQEIKDYSIYTKHDVYDELKRHVESVKFELLKSESAGTIKFFIISCFISFAVKNACLVLIDEIDSKLHSLLIKGLIETYNQGELNSLGSQMIFTTHNTILLEDSLRRDQYVVIEKNQWGESKIDRMHSLEHPIRIATSIEKEYRKGRLGGISKKINFDKNQGTLDF